MDAWWSIDDYGAWIWWWDDGVIAGRWLNFDQMMVKIRKFWPWDDFTINSPASLGCNLPVTSTNLDRFPCQTTSLLWRNVLAFSRLAPELPPVPMEVPPPILRRIAWNCPCTMHNAHVYWYMHISCAYFARTKHTYLWRTSAGWHTRTHTYVRAHLYKGVLVCVCGWVYAIERAQAYRACMHAWWTNTRMHRDRHSVALQLAIWVNI